MGVYTVTACIGIELGGNLRFLLVKAVLQQNPHKFVIHFLIRYAHGNFSFFLC